MFCLPKTAWPPTSGFPFRRFVLPGSDPCQERKEVTGMKDMLKKLRDQKGATAVEYGMMVALIAAVIVITVQTLGGQINTAFTTIVNAL